MTDYSLILVLQERLNELAKQKEKLESSNKKSVNGILKYETRESGKTYYYMVSSDKHKKQYLKKTELHKASSLAQRDYNRKAIFLIDKLTDKIRCCIDGIKVNSLEQFYSNIHKERKELISPLVYDKDSFVFRWKSIDYPPKPFPEDAALHITERGERVRSKSEVMIANALNKYGLPYRYEYPICLNGIEIRPDFTILNPNTRQEFIWEHFGMMDEPVYCENAMKKLSTYQENGILPGRKLIATYESVRFPLNKRLIEKTIREYFQ